MFVPAFPPKGQEYAYTELKRFRDALIVQDMLRLKPTAAVPDKPRDGEIRYTDGANWNPGAGAGIYAYYGGAWNRLG